MIGVGGNTAMNTKKLRYYVVRANERGLLKWLPDICCLHLIYWARLGKLLNLKKPQTFNEKLQWLKLYNRKPEYTVMVDKYEVKKYVADTIGEEYVIPTLGVWERFEDIDFDALPDRFVLKCTHDSGGLVIVPDKTKLDKIAAREIIQRSLKNNYFYFGREWPYRNVHPRIIAEQYMNNSGDRSDTEDLTDFKFMCFHGTVHNIFTVTERYSNSGLKVTFFDKEWNRLPFERHYPASKVDIVKPQNLEAMIMLAEKLSKEIPFLRVDFYEVAGKIYFGELTFFPGSGMEEFTPESWDLKLGELIDLQRLD